MNGKGFAVAFAAATIIVPSGIAAQTTVIGTAAQTTPAERVTLVQWGERVNKELNKQIHYPTLIGGQPFATGMVRVKFNCSESGRPDKVTLLKSSGSRALDRAAVAAMQHVATLHPLPDGMGHDQQYQAVILFETDQAAYDSGLKAMQAEAVKTNAWFKGSSMAATQVGPILMAGR